MYKMAARSKSRKKKKKKKKKKNLKRHTLQGQWSNFKMISQKYSLGDPLPK